MFAGPCRICLGTGRMSSTQLKDLGRCGARFRCMRMFDQMDFRGGDFRGWRLFEQAFLEEARLSHANLREVNLSGANLTRAILNEADLTRADLSDATLHGADLECAILEAANLQRADLRKAYLTGARVEGADLSGAILWGADLTGCAIETASVLEGTVLLGVDGLSVEQWLDAKDKGAIIDVAGAIRRVAARVPRPVPSPICLTCRNSWDSFYVPGWWCDRDSAKLRRSPKGGVPVWCDRSTLGEAGEMRWR